MSEFISLFVVFFKIGLFSFGGGTAMLPLIYQSAGEIGFISQREFSDMVALSQVTPGPVAVNAATYVGLTNSGIVGALVATLAVCLPCFIIMFFVSAFLDRVKGNKIVEGAFVGIRPVTIGLIGTAAVFIAKDMITDGPEMAVPVLIFAGSVVMMGKFKVKPILTMLIMAAAGSIVYGIAGIS